MKKELFNFIIGFLIFIFFIFSFVSIKNDDSFFTKENVDYNIDFKYGENQNILLNYDITVNPKDKEKVILEYYIPQSSYSQEVIDNNIKIIPTGPYDPSEYQNYYDHSIKKNKLGNKIGIIEIKNTDFPVEINTNYLIKSKQVEDFKTGNKINESEYYDNWRNPSDFINSNSDKIGRVTKDVISNPDLPKIEKTKNIYHYLQNKYEGSFPSLNENAKISNFINQESGHCENIAALYAALNRNSGIPSRVAIGTVGEGDYFLFHAWTEIFTEYGLIQADATYSNDSTYDFATISNEFVKIYHKEDSVKNYFLKDLPYNPNKIKHSDIAGRHYIIYYGWNNLEPEISQNISTEFVNKEEI
ncbi:MAG: transglutaminase-like domain-containing protein [archaeon]